MAEYYSAECERGLLGALMIDPERVYPLVLDAKLDPEAFFAYSNQLVFRACEWLARRERPISLLTVTDALRSNGKLDEAGGSAAVNALVDSCPTVTHAEYFLSVVLNKWVMRRMEEEGRKAIEEASAADADPKIVLASHIQRLSQMIETRSKAGKSDVWSAVKRKCIDARNGKLPGLPTPWSAFNKFAGGAPFGLVTLIAGRGSTRKSYLANQWALYAGVEAPDPIPGAYLPLEDGPEIAMRRAACLMAGVNAWHYTGGRVDDDQIERVDYEANRIIRSGLSVCGGRGMTVDDIFLELSKGKAKHGWRFALIDAFKDIRGGGKDIGVGEVYKSQRLCDAADKLGMAILVVHHIRKTVGEDDGFSVKENQWISLADIKGRGEITDDARMVCILQCERYRTPDGGAGLRNFVFDLQKSSHGPIGAMGLELDEETGRFTQKKG